MPVAFTRHNSLAGNVQNLMTDLHAKLVANGWTPRWANALAIGGGTLANPSWSASPAALAAAGTIVYRMPLGTLTNQWVVQISVSWSNLVSLPLITTRLAKDVDTGTGVLTNPMSLSSGAVNYNFSPVSHTETFVVANENGFLIAMNSSFGYLIGVERSRALDGTLEDDVIQYEFGGSSSGPGLGFGFSSVTATSFTCARSNWVTAQSAPARMGLLLNSAGTPVTNMTRADGKGFPVGFFDFSLGFGGQLRLVQCWLQSNAPSVGNARKIYVDGQYRHYYSANRVFIPTSCALLIAME